MRHLQQCSTVENGLWHHLNLELNQPRYLWLAAPRQPAQVRASELDPDAIRLIRAAADSDDGLVVTPESIGLDGLRAGDIEFMDGTNRSAAKWRGILKKLVSGHILDAVSKDVYRLSDKGYELADNARAAEQASRATEISLGISGAPDEQCLVIKSSRLITLRQLDFLTSADACVSTQSLDKGGEDISVRIAHDKVVALYNSPRPDLEPYDLSGPAKLRLVFRMGDRTQEVVLPILLKPKMVNNTQWITLTGSRVFELSA